MRGLCSKSAQQICSNCLHLKVAIIWFGRLYMVSLFEGDEESNVFWHKHMEKILFKKIELWFLILVCLVLVLAGFLFGWAAQHQARDGGGGGAFGAFLLKVAESPTPIIRFLHNASRTITPQKFEFTEFSDLRIDDENFQDNGYILVSGWNKDIDHGTVYLFDLKTQKRIFEWVPPVADILEATTIHGGQNDLKDHRAHHPVLTNKGEVILSSADGPIAKVDACGKLVWAVNHHFHHAIEQGPEGTLYAVSVVAKPEQFYNEYAPTMYSVTAEGHSVGPIRDDGFAIISPEGKIIQEWSVKDILEQNGYLGLLYGVGPFEMDRIHLNDAQPMLETDAFVNKGDVALSVRNLSTVFLFRPSTGRIIWLKTGPWLNQHDVDYHGNGKFTIFGNDFVRGTNMNKNGILNKGSAIYQYDQATDKISVAMDLGALGISIPIAGLHKVLDNGDVFIERPEYMLHRVGKDKIRWSFVNSVDEGEVGALNWSRYFSRDELDLSWMKNLSCNQQ